MQGASSILLDIRSQHGSQLHFKISPDKPPWEVICVYLARRSCTREETVFMYAGQRVVGHETCEDIEFESGDVMDAMEVQGGD